MKMCLIEDKDQEKLVKDVAKIWKCHSLIGIAIFQQLAELLRHKHFTHTPQFPAHSQQVQQYTSQEKHKAGLIREWHKHISGLTKVLYIVYLPTYC